MSTKVEIETAKQGNKCWKCLVKYCRGSRCGSDAYSYVGVLASFIQFYVELECKLVQKSLIKYQNAANM